jgi:hypothetical protein
MWISMLTACSAQSAYYDVVVPQKGLSAPVGAQLNASCCYALPNICNFIMMMVMVMMMMIHVTWVVRVTTGL